MVARFLLPFVIGVAVLVHIGNAAWGSSADRETPVSQASRPRRQQDETQGRMQSSLAALPSQHVPNGRRRLQQLRQPLQRKPKLQSRKGLVQGSESKPNSRKLGYTGPFSARQQGYVAEPQKESIASEGRHPCPTYYLIGAMKCGTSSLNKQIMDSFPSLYQHKKEYYVFPKSGPVRLNWYGTNASNTFRTLDSTPKYLYNHRTPHQMKEMCKFDNTPRFVVTLCDPVRRAWSHYRHNIKFNHRDMPEDGDLVSGFHQLALRFVPILRRCMDSQEREQRAGGYRSGPMTGKDFCSARISGRGDEIGFSLYLEHLRNWFQVFQESRFLVLLQEEWTEPQRGHFRDCKALRPRPGAGEGSCKSAH